MTLLFLLLALSRTKKARKEKATRDKKWKDANGYNMQGYTPWDGFEEEMRWSNVEPLPGRSGRGSVVEEPPPAYVSKVPSQVFNFGSPRSERRAAGHAGTANIV